MTSDAARNDALAAAKLGALVRAHVEGLVDPQPASFPDGAATVDLGSGRTWVLIEGDPLRRLGAALAVARRAGAPELHLLVTDEETAGVLARRGGLLSAPPQVWVVSGTALRPAVAAPVAADLAPPPEAELYRPVLVDAGLVPVVEGGHLLGELLGLEVGRVVVDDDGSAHVEAGVGRFDREVGAMMFAELGEADALTRAVDLVREVRRPGAARHPLNQLVPERWLRAALVAHPELVGAASLAPVGAAVPRANLKDAAVASAVGTDLHGRPLVVTCSTGVDLDLVPAAADDRLTHAPEARLVLAVPVRDSLPVTTELASSLAQPAEVVPIGDGWRELVGAR